MPLESTSLCFKLLKKIIKLGVLGIEDAIILSPHSEAFHKKIPTSSLISFHIYKIDCFLKGSIIRHIAEGALRVILEPYTF